MDQINKQTSQFKEKLKTLKISQLSSSSEIRVNNKADFINNVYSNPENNNENNQIYHNFDNKNLIIVQTISVEKQSTSNDNEVRISLLHKSDEVTTHYISSSKLDNNFNTYKVSNQKLSDHSQIKYVFNMNEKHIYIQLDDVLILKNIDLSQDTEQLQHFTLQILSLNKNNKIELCEMHLQNNINQFSEESKIEIENMLDNINKLTVIETPSHQTQINKTSEIIQLKIKYPLKFGKQQLKFEILNEQSKKIIVGISNKEYRRKGDEQLCIGIDGDFHLQNQNSKQNQIEWSNSMKWEINGMVEVLMDMDALSLKISDGVNEGDCSQVNLSQSIFTDEWQLSIQVTRNAEFRIQEAKDSVMQENNIKDKVKLDDNGGNDEIKDQGDKGAHGDIVNHENINQENKHVINTEIQKVEFEMDNNTFELDDIISNKKNKKFNQVNNNNFNVNQNDISDLKDSVNELTQKMNQLLNMQNMQSNNSLLQNNNRRNNAQSNQSLGIIEFNNQELIQSNDQVNFQSHQMNSKVNQSISFNNNANDFIPIIQNVQYQDQSDIIKDQEYTQNNFRNMISEKEEQISNLESLLSSCQLKYDILSKEQQQLKLDYNSIQKSNIAKDIEIREQMNVSNFLTRKIDSLIQEKQPGQTNKSASTDDLFEKSNALIECHLLLPPEMPKHIYNSDILNHCFSKIQSKNMNFNSNAKYRNYISFQHNDCLQVGFGLLSAKSTLTNSLYKIKDQIVNEVKVQSKRNPEKRSDLAQCLMDDQLQIHGGSDENFNTLGDIWRVNLRGFDDENVPIIKEEKRKMRLWELQIKDTLQFGARSGHQAIQVQPRFIYFQGGQKYTNLQQEQPTQFVRYDTECTVDSKKTEVCKLNISPGRRNFIFNKISQSEAILGFGINTVYESGTQRVTELNDLWLVRFRPHLSASKLFSGMDIKPDEGVSATLQEDHYLFIQGGWNGLKMKIDFQNVDQIKVKYQQDANFRFRYGSIQNLHGIVQALPNLFTNNTYELNVN